MRYILSFVGLVLAAIPGLTSGQQITFADKVHDCGQLKAGKIEKFDFVFTNTGTAALMVSNVQTSCGCTTAGEWTKQVEPGKTGRIPVQLNTSRIGGPINVTIRVASNDPKQPLMDLKLQGKVWERIDITPRFALFDLSRDTGPDSIRVLDITNRTGKPVTLSSPVINVTNYAAKIITNEPGRDYQLRVQLLSPPVPGQPQGLIKIPTSCPDQPMLAISALTVDPGTSPPSSGTSIGATEDFRRLDDSQVAGLFRSRQGTSHRIAFVDARDDQDYRAGHIPGAHNFDPYHLRKNLATVLPACRAAEQVVVYCQGTGCDDSRLAAVALRQNGIPADKIAIDVGGMSGWSALHLPVEVSDSNGGQP